MKPGRPRLVVAGSFNLDMIVRVDHLPAPGEAVHALSMQRDLGGKGFNQAVAARRLGAEVAMFGAVGRDPAGDEFAGRLRQLGIDGSGVRRVDQPTGLAVPVVDRDGQNWIVVGLGANLAVVPQDASELDIEGAGLLLLQGELRAETNAALAKRAASQGVHVLLNAAPAAPDLEAVVPLVDTVVVNEGEEAALGGAERLLKLGADQVVVTLGAAGARLQGRVTTTVPAPRVRAVDTTGAGDAFVGALAVAYLEGATTEATARWAAAAGAAACLRPGTSASMPDRAEVEALLR